MPISAFLFMRADSADLYGVFTLEGHKDTAFLKSCVETLPFQKREIYRFDFNGLLLISRRVCPTEFYVSNPATRQIVSIPVNPNHTTQSKKTTNLAFNPNTNTYKIVRIEYSSDGFTLLSDFEIFSSVTGTWGSFRMPLECWIMGFKWVPRFVYLNENLYTLSTSNHLLCFDLHGTDD